MSSFLTPGEQAERSLITKFREPVWNRFIGAVKDYALIAPGDRIAVCVSGGKDSMLMAKCMQHLAKYSDFPFSVEYLAMDPGYPPESRANLEENGARLGIPLHIFDSGFFSVLKDADCSPCYLCARMRRGFLYETARRLGCNKIALGHHFNDVIETTLMCLLYAAEFKTMLPKLRSAHFPGMELIRPLYYVREEDILRWADFNALDFLRCTCRLTERNGGRGTAENSARQEIRSLIQTLRRKNRNVDIHIFRSLESVNLSALLGHRRNSADPVHSFLEDYGPDGVR